MTQLTPEISVRFQTKQRSHSEHGVTIEYVDHPELTPESENLRGATAIIELCGLLDAITATTMDELFKTLILKGIGNVVVSMAEVIHLSSAALREIRVASQDKNAPRYFWGEVSPKAMQTITLSGLENEIDLLWDPDYNEDPMVRAARQSLARKKST